MSKKIYIAVDVQNDFVSGSLGSQWAQDVTRKICVFLDHVSASDKDSYIWATRDTHCDEYTLTPWTGIDQKKHEECIYENTLEGKKLPVRHCIYNTEGWEVVDAIRKYITGYINKPTFMSENLKKETASIINEVDEIVLFGFCTSICVISNALYLRGLYPNMKITVLDDLCACLNEDTHKAALTVMGCCQIDIENSEEFLKR